MLLGMQQEEYSYKDNFWYTLIVGSIFEYDTQMVAPRYPPREVKRYGVVYEKNVFH